MVTLLEKIVEDQAVTCTNRGFSMDVKLSEFPAV